MFDIEINKLFTVNDSVEMNFITEDNIRKYLKSIFKRDIYFPSNWKWSIDNTTHFIAKTKYSGSLSKRIKKYLHNSFNINLSQRQMGELGEIIRQIRNQNKTFQCKFVNNFDWKAGDFGDEGSCFWGVNEPAKNLLLDHGACPVLFYENGKGIARAITINRDDYLIIFNAYFFNLEEVAIILSNHFGCEYKIKPANNMLDSHNLICINHKQGAILYYDKKIGDIDIYIDIDTSNYSMCMACNCFYHHNEMIRTNVGSNDVDLYCEYCLEWLGDFRCDDCGEVFLEDNVESQYVKTINKLLCPSCFNKYDVEPNKNSSTPCDNCGKILTKDDESIVTEINIDSGFRRLICEQCFMKGKNNV